MSVALVIVSHSAQLASGLAELAGQMAKDVTILPAGGTDDGRIGTSYDLVEAAVAQARAAGHDVAILSDLGSANMTIEAVLDDLSDADRDHVVFAEGPLVEGAVAAAVTSQIGGDLPAVTEAAKARELFA
ncbi:MAG: PTS-dependent dihydroxyacetone kinase phosphotransferase subunit DhaM [Propionibacteriaceae bacterium]|jgi:PTS hybrid protein|nr:PTS-dependent dihydroxyacetone kinase phosphotransferase subunit DhaM [Propionibacteriaceae bacterium]